MFPVLLVFVLLFPSVIIDRYQWLLLRYKRIEFVAVGFYGFDSICFLKVKMNFWVVLLFVVRFVVASFNPIRDQSHILLLGTIIIDLIVWFEKLFFLWL